MKTDYFFNNVKKKQLMEKKKMNTTNQYQILPFGRKRRRRAEEKRVPFVNQYNGQYMGASDWNTHNPGRLEKQSARLLCRTDSLDLINM